MKPAILEIITSGRNCVLATCAEDRPHTSLMNYLVSPDGLTFFLMTSRRSRKYRNISQNPRVSLMIDTRVGAGPDEKVRAVTVSGVRIPWPEDEDQDEILRRLSAAQSDLKELALDPELEVFVVRAESFLLLDGALDAHFETVKTD